MTAWLEGEQLEAWVKLAAVAELLPAALDSQLRRDADLTLFEYLVLSQLSEAPNRVLRMPALAAQTNATLPRLPHLVRRLEAQSMVERVPCPADARATNARLTEVGWAKVVDAAPGHATTVRDHVIDRLTGRQIHQLSVIAEAI